MYNVLCLTCHLCLTLQPVITLLPLIVVENAVKKQMRYKNQKFPKKKKVFLCVRSSLSDKKKQQIQIANLKN